MRSAELTFVMLTRNEEASLGRALASLPSGANLFVLDAYSNDRTPDIAAAFGAVVEQRVWTTFVEARRYAVTRVKTPWLFMLDADEALTPELCQSLEYAAEDIDGYQVIRRNYLCGQVVRGGSWANELLLRCVRREAAVIEAQAAGGLHERITVAGATELLAGSLEHHSYPTLASYCRKFARYTAVEASASHARFRDVIAAIPLMPARALYHLIMKRGYRDGWRGVFIAFASAAYPVVVCYRAWRGCRAITFESAGNGD